VTVRDADTFSQITYFDPGFAITGIAAGTNNDLYLTGGNSIGHYSNTGTLLNNFSWPNTSIEYSSISVGNGNIFASYQGAQTGVTVRDAQTLNQSQWFSTAENNGVGSANEDRVYGVSGNEITSYDVNGATLNNMIFPSSSIEYTNVDVGNNEIYASYAGSQNGVTVRDADTLAQLNYIALNFAINGLAAGDNDDMYLTSANSIFHYSDAGSLINSFSFPDQGIVYGDIAYATEVPEPGTLGLLAFGLFGLVSIRRRQAS